MKDKKHPSAQALSDDNLENVGGGFGLEQIVHLSEDEWKYLSDQGWSSDEQNQMYDAQGNLVDDFSIVEETLTKGGFTRDF